jgi:hypothetical protein
MANGIPALLSTIDNVANNIALVVADAELVLAMFAAPAWGVYLNGFPAIVPDSIAAVEFKADWRVSDFTQEAGAFQTYNKVRMPYDARVTMTKGGTSAARAAFLYTVETAAASLNLYSVVTPDRTYPSATIDHYDYRRTDKNGVGLLTVDLWLMEVRVTATTTFSNTQAPSGAASVNDGNVQAQQVPNGDATPGNVSFIQSQNQSVGTSNLSPATAAAIQSGVA